jgi:para-aminobenzoate synthetase / 4-amino-4-deoxychorismate lyase
MSRPVVVLDIGAQHGLTHVFEDMAGLIVARTPGEVEPALQALDAARSRGFYAAGYFSYELGYALELKLVELMPAERDLPLIWFGALSFAEGTRRLRPRGADRSVHAWARLCGASHLRRYARALWAPVRAR